MFQLSKKVKNNMPYHRLLNNGYVFALINTMGEIVKTSRYHYQLSTIQKAYPGSEIVRIEDLLH